MTVIGQRLHLRLFLEGIEVPVVAATVQSQPGAPAACSIQIPFNDFALDMKPRTLVHLYFFDLYNGGPTQDELSVGGAGITVQNEVDPDVQSQLNQVAATSTEEQTRTDLENQNYRMLFGGEVVGFAFAKTPTSRSIVLQCLDWSSYWDIAFQYMGGGNLFGPGQRALFTGSSSNLFNSFLDGTGDVVYRLFNTPPRAYPSLRGTLLGGITHIIEAIGGIYFGRRAIRGFNDFFSLAEMRLHITQMIGANPYAERDETRLLNARGFGGLFSKALSGLGKQVSVRAVLTALQKYIFHEVVPITTPKHIPALFDPTQQNVQTTTIAQEADLAPIAAAADIIKRRATELIQKQQTSTDSQTAQQQSGTDLDRVVKRLARDCDLANQKVRRVVVSGDSSGQIRYVDGSANQRLSSIFAICGSNFNNVVAILEARANGTTPFIFPLSTSREAQQIVALLTQINALLDEAKALQLRKRVPRTSTQPDPPPRLLTQIYRPDVWMVSPPRCNVIFPELYTSLNYGRDTMQEPTRFLLRTHSAFFGSDALFDGFYFAPSRLTGSRSGRRQFRGRGSINPPEASDAPGGFIRDLMDHELYTGIIPVFERMSDLNLHALGGGGIDIDGVRVRYAQLAANHIFFQKRFQSRQLTVMGKFNPYVALGFPSLVIDRYMPAYEFVPSIQSANSTAQLLRDGEGELGADSPEERERIRLQNEARIASALNELLDERPLTHYLGTPQVIVHTMSAQDMQGSTQIQMGYARTTNEKTEFLGDNLNAAAQARRTRNAPVRTDVAAFQPPAVGARGIRGGRITQVTDVTDQYQRRAPTRTTNRTATGQAAYLGGPRLPLFVPDRTYAGRRRRVTQVAVGISQPAASYGPEVVALVGSGGTTQTATGQSVVNVEFKAFRIVEDIGVYSRELVDLPPEDLTFPPWYGEHYRSQNIGGLYSYYFGTGAITDPTTILGPGTSPQQLIGDPTGTNPASITLAASDPMSSIAPLVDNTDQPGVSGANIPGGGGVPGPPGQPAAGQSTVGLIAERSTISTSVEELVRIYSQVKHRHLDVDQFIKAYTWRPIATMVDIFGSANLEIDDTGTVTQGVEGFHSRAFGDYDDLRTLVAPGQGGQPPTVLGLSIYDPRDIDVDNAQPLADAAVAARLDTRKEKRIHVLKYLHALLNQRAVG